jgi:hypothetical protein
MRHLNAQGVLKKLCQRNAVMLQKRRVICKNYSLGSLLLKAIVVSLLE